LLQNLDSQTVIWIALASMVILGLLIASNKMRRSIGFVARTVLGIVGIVGINFAMGALGFSLTVGINFFTIAVVAFLGIPGIVMLYGLGFFM